jgi:hypothetical protein
MPPSPKAAVVAVAPKTASPQKRPVVVGKASPPKAVVAAVVAAPVAAAAAPAQGPGLILPRAKCFGRNCRKSVEFEPTHASESKSGGLVIGGKCKECGGNVSVAQNKGKAALLGLLPRVSKADHAKSIRVA